jgi:hypothetical protein
VRERKKAAEAASEGVGAPSIREDEMGARTKERGRKKGGREGKGDLCLQRKVARLYRLDFLHPFDCFFWRPLPPPTLQNKTGERRGVCKGLWGKKERGRGAAGFLSLSFVLVWLPVALFGGLVGSKRQGSQTKAIRHPGKLLVAGSTWSE